MSDHRHETRSGQYSAENSVRASDYFGDRLTERIAVSHTERVSISCDASNAPIIFHWYAADHGKSVGRYFHDLLVEAGVTSEHVLALVKAELRQRILDYQAARLTNVLDIKTIGRNPGYALFEIRLKIRGIGLLRMYLIEPHHLGAVGVGLHMHLKDTGANSKLEVNQLQDVEIDIATRRCAAGRPTNWDFPS